MNGADLLCDTLLANGVDTCFANPGTSEMHFVGALDRKPAMRCVLGLFEGVVTGAADGYARMTGRPAATLLHTGPGLANGLANLHNARRGRSPVVNIVGDHASHHLAFDSALASDIQSLAKPMSKWVKRVESVNFLAASAAETVSMSRADPGGVATLILPADVAWSPAEDLSPVVASARRTRRVPAERVLDIARALRNGKRSLLLLSGDGLHGDALMAAGRIAEATGARLAAERFAARIARGQGRVPVDRVPYKLEAALEYLYSVDQLIIVGAHAPAAVFAYPGQPSRLTRTDCAILTLADAGEDLAGALQALADALDAAAPRRLAVERREQEVRRSGALSGEAITEVVGRRLPEQAILCDEAISSGGKLFDHTWDAAPHDYLVLTGGAIGNGFPMATGAAIACPDRKVVSLQADGSGMYTVQALWTQARERLDIVTVVFANRGYRILHGELGHVGAGTAGLNASRMLDLDDPALDWVSLARGMGVEGTRVVTIESFEAAFASALKRRGPFLIECVL